MGNICNIFSNHNHKKKYENKLNISTPQFIQKKYPLKVIIEIYLILKLYQLVILIIIKNHHKL